MRKTRGDPLIGRVVGAAAKRPATVSLLQLPLRPPGAALPRRTDPRRGGRRGGRGRYSV